MNKDKNERQEAEDKERAEPEQSNTETNMLSFGKPLSLEQFVKAASAMETPSAGSLFVIDVRSVHSQDGVLRMALPNCRKWFDVPMAAIKSVSPVGLGCNNDPTKILTSVVFRDEFQSLASTFQALGYTTEHVGMGFGYSGVEPLPINAININAPYLRLDQPEPCPIMGDAFLGDPGALSNIGVDPPPAGTYVRITYYNKELGPHRVLIRQRGRIVGRFYGDLSDERPTNTFFSDGGDIEFEFQRCDEYTDGSHEWNPLYNFGKQVSGPPVSGSPDYRININTDNGQTGAAIEWGPNIVPPPPPAPPAYFWVGGRIQCGGFLWKVATNYAFAWVTTTPDRNGPRLAVPRLSVTLYIDCRQFKTSNTVNNQSDVVASEQFRGINVPVCCDIRVHGEATLANGRKLTGDINIKEP